MVVDCIGTVVAVLGAAECAEELLVEVEKEFLEERLVELSFVGGVGGFGFEGLADGGFLERGFGFGRLLEAGEERVSWLGFFYFGWGVLGTVPFEHFVEFLFDPELLLHFL